MGQPVPSHGAIEPDLVALLAAEARLERVLDDARASAQALREAAAEAVERDDAAAASTLTVELAALEIELTTATAAAVAALEAATRAEAARWDAVHGDELDGACDRLLSRLAAMLAEDTA